MLRLIMYAVLGFFGLIFFLIVLGALFGGEPVEAEDPATLFFEANRDSILTVMQAHLDEEDYYSAETLGYEYQGIEDEELHSLYNQAREQILLRDVKRLPASFPRENFDMYSELLEIDSTNTLYQERVAYYGGILEERRQAHRDHVAKYGEPPEQRSWGSYDVVRDYLQRIANDPRSIDITNCTDVRRVDDGWLVGCEYRGRNAFGAMVRNSNWFIVRHGRVVAHHPSDRYAL